MSKFKRPSIQKLSPAVIKTRSLKKHYRNWTFKRQRKEVLFYHLSKEKITEAQLNEFFDWCLHWCHNKFGKVKGHSIPQIEWEWKDRELQRQNLLGMYWEDDNLISLRIEGHRNIYNLAETIIHEYVHYMQARHGNWYERYDKKLGYSNNPYEIEAYFIGETYAVDCARTVMRWMIE